MTPAAFHARSETDAWSAAEVAGHASEFPVTFATQALALSNSLVNGEPFTVRQVIEMLIVDHLAGHLAQLGAT